MSPLSLTGDLPPLSGSRPLGLAPLKKIPPLPKSDARKEDTNQAAGDHDKNPPIASTLSTKPGGSEPSPAEQRVENGSGKKAYAEENTIQVRSIPVVGFSRGQLSAAVVSVMFFHVVR